ncbi:MAG: IS1182 family transposase [Bacillota bacterium]
MVYIKSNANQTTLIPRDIRTIISKNHICYLIEDVINQLDFSEYDESVKGAGNPSYHPRINLKIIIYGICDRITSTRKLEKLTHENIIYRYLSENLHPNFHTFAMFRKNNHDLIKSCFLQTIEVGKKLNMINFNKLYLDGTKIKANASKSKTFTKEEINFLSDFLDSHLTEMDKTDLEEDKIFGDSNGEAKIPDNLTSRRKLQEKIKELLKDVKKGKNQLSKAKEKIESENVDKVNITDIDSKLIKMKKGLCYEQGYNCQFLVEDKSEFIVGNYLSNSANDSHETIPTMEKFKAEQNINLENVEIFQDNGYSGSKTAEYYENEKAIPFIPDSVTTKELHGKSYKISKFDNDNFKLDFKNNQVICPSGQIMNFKFKRIKKKETGNWTNVYQTEKCYDCTFQKECVGLKTKRKKRDCEINPLQRKIRLRFKTKEGLEKYNKRFHKGEIAQAHILYNLGYREFKTRLKKTCKNEVNLFSIAYNLKKIHNKLKKINGSLSKSMNETFEKILILFKLRLCCFKL